jgi:hypothetical protein
MYLEELYDYPNKFAKKIIACQPIIDLLKDQLGSECPDDTILNPDTKLQLPYGVYGWDNVDGVCTVAGSYICVDTDVTERTSEILAGMRFYIYIIVHDSMMKLPSMFKRKGSRRDNLASEIDKLLANDFSFGKTKLRLSKRNPVSRFKPAEGYSGRLLIYECEDSQRVGYPK